MTISKVLITGGTGFVGYWMHQYWLKNFSDKIEYSYISSEQYHKLGWDEMDWTHIVHLAPIAPYRVVKCAKRNNARLLYCSSGIVYHPENNTEYRRNKLAWEKYCLDSDIDLVIARLFTFYGEHLDKHKAYTQFFRAALHNSPIEIWGDGKTVRSYMHGSELGKWMWAILLRGQNGEAYDVGDDTPVTMLQLAKSIKLLTQSQSAIVIKHGKDPVPYYMPPNTAKTKALLNG